MNTLRLVENAVMGHIIGDALGVPVEFFPREKLSEAPVTDMRAFGSHNVPAGTWSDDSSMMLCTKAILNGCKKG